MFYPLSISYLTKIENLISLYEYKTAGILLQEPPIKSIQLCLRIDINQFSRTLFYYKLTN